MPIQHVHNDQPSDNLEADNSRLQITIVISLQSQQGRHASDIQPAHSSSDLLSQPVQDSRAKRLLHSICARDHYW